MNGSVKPTSATLNASQSVRITGVPAIDAAAGADGLMAVRSFPDPSLAALVLPCREVFSNPRRRGFGQYSNTVKNFFDYVENWIKERF
ncbi:hypothetical protein JYU09_00435 [bacterium AH-315-O15]|nr:hypothetical protein [bacterium AH-315-O15]